mmetsp:Transcript_49605/g.92224  ORF Transcript_49605/g.92224 Transcript_49605/m.92224 type:complete len:440 (+) Transcript_49605:842-2161(+)
MHVHVKYAAGCLVGLERSAALMSTFASSSRPARARVRSAPLLNRSVFRGHSSRSHTASKCSCPSSNGCDPPPAAVVVGPLPSSSSLDPLRPAPPSSKSTVGALGERCRVGFCGGPFFGPLDASAGDKSGGLFFLRAGSFAPAAGKSGSFVAAWSCAAGKSWRRPCHCSRNARCLVRSVMRMRSTTACRTHRALSTDKFSSTSCPPASEDMRRSAVAAWNASSTPRVSGYSAASACLVCRRKGFMTPKCPTSCPAAAINSASCVNRHSESSNPIPVSISLFAVSSEVADHAGVLAASNAFCVVGNRPGTIPECIKYAFDVVITSHACTELWYCLSKYPASTATIQRLNVLSLHQVTTIFCAFWPSAASAFNADLDATSSSRRRRPLILNISVATQTSVCFLPRSAAIRSTSKLKPVTSRCGGVCFVPFPGDAESRSLLPF